MRLPKQASGSRYGAVVVVVAVTAAGLLRPHFSEAYWTGLRARFAAPRLTARQLELLDLVRQGLTNRSIARHLGVSEGTVRTHLNHVYARLGVLSRTEAVDRMFFASRA